MNGENEVKKVSVIVPNYNYARYFDRRIDSILRQTYPVYELIVLDDCSSDNSEIVIERKLKEVREKHPELKIQFIQSVGNSGKAMIQWKKGIGAATGEFIWIAEVDDLSRRKFLEEAMKGFENPEVVMSYTESMVINKLGLVIAPNFRWSRDKEKTGHYKKSYVKDGRREIEEIMAIRCTVPNVSAVVFKNDKRLIKYLDEALKFTQVGDWHFYMRVLGDGKISYNRKSLNKFRVHKGSVTSNARKARRHLREIKKMHEIFKRDYDLSEEMVRKMDAEVQRVEERINASVRRR